MATRKPAYERAATPLDGVVADYRFETNGESAITSMSGVLESVTPLQDADGTPFYRLRLKPEHYRTGTLARLHRVVVGVSQLNGDDLTGAHVLDMDPGSDPAEAHAELDVRILDATDPLLAEQLTAGLTSLLGAYEQALEDAATAGAAAAVGNDGGAAATAALQADLATFDISAAAATAAAAAAAAGAGSTSSLAAYDAAFESILTALDTDLNAAIDTGEAAVVATDGGAAILAALQAAISFVAAAAATAAAAAGVAVSPGRNIEAALDAALASAFTSLLAAINTAIDAGEAAVVATDGGAAAYTALAASIGAYDEATAAATAGAAGEAATTPASLAATAAVGAGRGVFVSVVYERSSVGG